MLLQRLREYADERIEMPPTLYSETPIRYIIQLNADGRLLGTGLIDTAVPGNRAARRGTRRLAPQVQRANTIRPLLLADNAEYTLGIAREKSKPERVSQLHAAFVEIVERCANETGEPSLDAVMSFLQGDAASKLSLSDDFDASALITFRVDDAFPIELASVQEFWAREHDPGASDDAISMQCLVCGDTKPVLKRLQAKIKGIPGGQTSGTSIISANADAFESYGLSNSLIAPTCAECGEKFTKAVNELLAGDQTQVKFPSAAFIFWTRKDTPFKWGSFMTDPDETDVRALIESVRTGGPNPDIDDTAFYGAVLSGSGGRAVVRDWIDTTVGEARIRLADWFQRQMIVTTDGENSRPLGVYALCYATIREPRDLAPPVPRSVIRSAFAGTSLPWNLLYQAVNRNRAEQRVTRPRAALIKLVMMTQDQSKPEDYMVKLEFENRDPAYLCGRLLYELEEAQRAAIPGINATIVDRYFGTASSAPVSVFSRLLRGAQPHLAKLRRDRPGVYYAIQQRITDILEHLPAFPKTLTLEQQGLFALGYYHQRAHERARAREAAERRREDQNSTVDNPQNNQGEE